MTDYVSQFYIIDLAYVLTVIGIMISHYYHVSVRHRRTGYILILFENIRIVGLLYWFNIRHSGISNRWNTGQVSSYTVSFLVLEFLIMTACIIIDNHGKEQINVLNNDSIAEAILHLPAGLCFSEIDGQIVLENENMQDIWYQCNGKIMTDANEAWDYLEKNIDEDGLLRLSDGTVWNIERQEVSLAEHVYIRTKADNVTELNNLYDQLKETNWSLDIQNRKTRQLLMNIAKINEEEERLDIQRQIHHEIGQCIIAAEHYLNDEGDDNTLHAIITMWERVFRGNVESEEMGSMEEKKKEIVEAALISGCQVQFIGQRPQKEKLYLLYLAAVREAVTNAIWHGQAKHVCVEGTIQESTWADINEMVISITNDGAKPQGPIEEGIGLGKLREKLEREGIRMEILCEDGIEMRLHFVL